MSEFFVKHDHKEISRYPVVCRWRPDLYFTVASIVDFQRVEGSSVVFEFPENPLVVPQMCLRFVDIGNVGVTGRHYSSFCMIGQHALSNKKGYWKDQCIELDYELLTSEFGIPKEEIVFKEDVWLGPGAFGNSLEYYVRGLELGNAVFTGFKGTPADYQEYSEKVVDMGAGLERFVWITQGTPTSYDAVFPKVIDKLKESSGFVEELEDRESLLKYFRLAGELDVEQFRLGGDTSRNLLAKSGLPPDFDRKLLSLQAIYSIADHLRTLAFAISDGALPSNVGGGYNLRVLYRRAADFAEKIGLGQDLALFAELHVKELRPMYPELLDHLDDIRNILEVEQRKYSITKIRATKIIESLGKKKGSVNEQSLIQLYDSDGITPETLLSAGIKMEIPSDFYSRVTERHMIQKKEDGAEKSFDLQGLPQTRLLFYENRDLFEFDAKALRIVNGRYLVLDMTSFYARSGGQEPDHGTINGCKVVNVIKSNGIILHELSNFDTSITVGSTLHGIVDSKRRGLIMRHHTATHVLNAAARKVLGSWVWQHSAFKDVDMGRLDITHFAHLTREQVVEIERISNEVVRRNLVVNVSWMPRKEAEKEYGFRLYQGGVVPNKELRIVRIEDWDVEACGGTHCSTTGEIGLIKITKAERVQDGVERLEFVAGEPAVKYVEQLESLLLESATSLETPIEKVPLSILNLKKREESSEHSSRLLSKRLANVMVEEIPKKSKVLGNGVKLFVSGPNEEGLDRDYHLVVGESLLENMPELVYVAFFHEKNMTSLLVFSGTIAQGFGAGAGQLVKSIAESLGGSGGGGKKFAQGGVPSMLRVIPDIEKILRSSMKDSDSTTPN